MRRWLAVLVGVTAIAVTGTAVAVTGSGAGEEGAATDTTLRVEADQVVATTTTTVDRSPKPISTTDVVEKVVAKDGLDRTKREVRLEPADRTPPLLTILHPENGQVYEQKEIVLEGITEPGAVVYSGEHEADVGDEGSWRIVLQLSPGENVIEMKAHDAWDNHSVASVTVVYRPPVEVEKPKDEPKKEEPKKEEPKKEEPKKEEPKPEEVEWEFAAYQVYGECGETPPYDVFHGTAKPGSIIHVTSEFGSAETEVGEHGKWEVKVIFESAPVGEVFLVEVKDGQENHEVFEFVRTG